METNTIIVGIIGLISTVISGWTSWFYTRKKYNAEVDGNYIKNLEKAIKTYDAIIKHNRDEIEYLSQQNDELRKEVEELRKQVLTLTMNICMDLTCGRRIREYSKEFKNNGNNKDRFSETQSPSRRGCEYSEKE